MRDLYGDDYASVAGDGEPKLISDKVRRLAGAAVFLGLVATLGLWSYRLGTRDAAEVPIVRAMEGPARIEPQDPGGSQAAHQGLEVNAVLAGRPAVVPDEVPAPKPVPEVLVAEDVAQGELVLSAPQAMAARVLNGDPGRDLPAPQEDLATTADIAAAEDDAGLLGGPEADPPAETSAVAPVVAAPRPMNRPGNLVIARAQPAEAASPTPVAAPAARTAAPARPAAAAPREVAGVGKGTRLVQLGVFDNEATTRKAWEQLAAKNPDLLASKSLYVERTTANARVFYRLRVAGFASSEQTRTLCEALRARGVDCIPVTLQ